MFIGHFAIGFASKPLAPRSSLGVLIAAPMFLDILWPIFVALGLEHVRIAAGFTKVVPLDLYDYPYSHSLAMTAVWSIVFGVSITGSATKVAQASSRASASRATGCWTT